MPDLEAPPGDQEQTEPRKGHYAHSHPAGDPTHRRPTLLLFLIAAGMLLYAWCGAFSSAVPDEIRLISNGIPGP